MDDITWDEIKAIEPALADLEATCLRERLKDYDVYPMWYAIYKPYVTNLVGRWAQSNDPRIHTERAYDVAYRHLLLALELNCIKTPYDSRAEEIAAIQDEEWR